MWQVVREEGILPALVYLAYVTGSRLAVALPERPAYATAHLLGAVAGLASREGVEVVGMEAAAVSYPGFEAHLAELLGGRQ